MFILLKTSDLSLTAVALNFWQQKASLLSSSARQTVLTAWILQNSADLTFTSFVGAHPEELKKHLSVFCSNHSIDPDEKAVAGKILQWTNPECICSFVPLLNTPVEEYARFVLTSRADNNQARNSALEFMKRQLANPDKLWSDIPGLESMCAVEEIYQFCKKHKYAFWGTDVTKILNCLLTECDSYFNGFSTNAAKEVPSNIIEQHKRLEQQLKEIGHDVNFVSDFFSIYHISEIKERASMYMRLLRHKESIMLTSDVIEKLITDISANLKSLDGNISSYQISLILLYAILEAPDKWSEQFYQLFAPTILFIERGLDLPATSPMRRGFAYYKTFLPEFKLLRTLYLRINNKEGEPDAPFPAQPSMPILANVGANSGVNKIMSGEFYKDFALLHMLYEYLTNKEPIVAEKALKTISSMPNLGANNGFLPLYSELVGDILSIQPSVINQMINSEWQNYFKSKIVNIWNIRDLLEPIPEDSRVDFMVKVLTIEFVTSKIVNIWNIRDLLEPIPEDSRVDFMVKVLTREFVTSKIVNIWNILDLLKLIPEGSRVDFMVKVLTIEFVTSKIVNIRNILDLLEPIQRQPS